MHAVSTDTDLALAGWRLWRDPAAGSGQPGYLAQVSVTEAGFGLDLQLTPTQPVLLQGQEGYSRKGPGAAQASHYLSQPQIAGQAQLQLDARQQTLHGRAWLDHEWSNSLLDADAVGWD